MLLTSCNSLHSRDFTPRVHTGVYNWIFWLYKEQSIISGTGAVICSKINFRPTGHHHPWSSLLLRVCTVPSASTRKFDFSACQDKFLLNIHLDVKGNEEHAPTSRFNFLAFSVCPEPSMPFKHPCTAHAFFAESLPNHYQGLRSTFCDTRTKFHAVPSLVPSENRTNPNKRTYKISTATQPHEILYTDSQDMLVPSSTVV
jgi:hypothetical protein